MEKPDFLIPLNGLAAGKTVLFWTAGKEFFEGFGNSEILDASLRVETVVEKSGHYIGIDCHIEGGLTVECDRCLGELHVPVDSVAKLSVKFGSGEGQDAVAEDDGREIVFVSESDTVMDMRQTIYDYACLALPMQKVHAEGECDPGMMRYLGRVQENEVPDKEENPFSALKNIFRS